MDWSPADPTDTEHPSITCLPPDIISLILEQVPPSGDRSTAPVCRLFNATVKTLPDSTLTVYGADKWKEVFGIEIEGEGVPSLPEGIYQSSRALRKRLAGEWEAPVCLAILMPKGLTLEMVRNFNKIPFKNDNDLGYYWEGGDHWDIVFNAFGEVPIEKSYWFVITNDVIEGSKFKDDKIQKQLVNEKTESVCEVPRLLEVIVCCMMNYASTGKYLFGYPIYTRCQEQIFSNPPLFVGGITSDGIRVDHVSSAHEHGGVAACRRF